MCVKLHTFCKTSHFVQYQSSFFHVSIGKFYTWLNFFTQPAVVMVVTSMKYDHEKEDEKEDEEEFMAINVNYGDEKG